MVWPPRVVVTSTTGLAPLTVTVSATLPTFNVMSIRATKPTDSSTLSRIKLWNPWSSACTR